MKIPAIDSNILIKQVSEWHEEQQCNDEHDLSGSFLSNLVTGRIHALYEDVEKFDAYFNYSPDVYAEALNWDGKRIWKLLKKIQSSKMCQYGRSLTE